MAARQPLPLPAAPANLLSAPHAASLQWFCAPPKADLAADGTLAVTTATKTVGRQAHTDLPNQPGGRPPYAQPHTHGAELPTTTLGMELAGAAPQPPLAHASANRHAHFAHPQDFWMRTHYGFTPDNGGRRQRQLRPASCARVGRRLRPLKHRRRSGFHHRGHGILSADSIPAFSELRHLPGSHQHPQTSKHRLVTLTSAFALPRAGHFYNALLEGDFVLATTVQTRPNSRFDQAGLVVRGLPAAAPRAQAPAACLRCTRAVHPAFVLLLPWVGSLGSASSPPGALISRQPPLCQPPCPLPGAAEPVLLAEDERGAPPRPPQPAGRGGHQLRLERLEHHGLPTGRHRGACAWCSAMAPVHHPPCLPALCHQSAGSCTRLALVLPPFFGQCPPRLPTPCSKCARLHRRCPSGCGGRAATIS